jgi:phosphoribosylanthranilate isomerase
MTKVKICGIQRVEVLQSMVHLPIDYIGFVFANSRRQVTPEVAATLRETYLKLILTSTNQPAKFVGVFVNPTMEQLAYTIQTAALDIVQLHGQETAEFCKRVKSEFGVLVYKALPAPSKESTPQLDIEPYVGSVDGFLLDTVLPGIEGGSGQTFDWTVLPPYIAFAKEKDIPLFVAGGLNQENVQNLIEEYEPYAVDVSSGVETDGQKDIRKITEFVERVKNG